MSFGIDIYRYQTVTSWQRVRDAGVKFVYVKATDGAGYAVVRADAQARGAQSVGIPVGLYHFAQPGDPVSQARLLLSEVRRLSAGKPGPALDMEDNPAGSAHSNIPNSQKSAWSKLFLREVAAAGYRPVVYMSSSLAKLLRPDLWGIPNLVIWIASYGPNNGRRNALTGGYPGRLDIHQYTSAGAVAGITGAVDLNESLTDILTDGDTDMNWDDTVVLESQTSPGYTETHKYSEVFSDIYFKTSDDWNITGRLETKLDVVADIVAKLQTGTGVGADPAAVAAIVIAQLKRDLAPLFDLAQKLES